MIADRDVWHVARLLMKTRAAITLRRSRANTWMSGSPRATGSVAYLAGDRLGNLGTQAGARRELSG